MDIEIIEVNNGDILKKILNQITNDNSLSEDEKFEILNNLKNLKENITNEATKIAAELDHSDLIKEDIKKDLSEVIKKFIPLWEPEPSPKKINTLIKEGKEYLIKSQRYGGWGSYSNWMHVAELPKGIKKWTDEPPIRIWDTATTVVALLQIGESQNSKVIKNSIEWLKKQVRNDDGGFPSLPIEYWKYLPPHYSPIKSSVYETSYATIALLEAGEEVDSLDIQKNVNFLLEVQDDMYKAWGSTPFEEMSVGATSSAIMALMKAGIDPNAECIQKAVLWLKDNQLEDGGWSDTWKGGQNKSLITKTYDALCALLATGISKEEETIQNGVRFLITIQGFIGDEKGEWGWVWSQDAGFENCNIENTATAVTAILKAGLNQDSFAVKAGIRYLVKIKDTENCWGKDTPRVIVSLNEYLENCRIYRFDVQNQLPLNPIEHLD